MHCRIKQFRDAPIGRLQGRGQWQQQADAAAAAVPPVCFRQQALGLCCHLIRLQNNTGPQVPSKYTESSAG